MRSALSYYKNALTLSTNDINARAAMAGNLSCKEKNMILH